MYRSTKSLVATVTGALGLSHSWPVVTHETPNPAVYVRLNARKGFCNLVFDDLGASFGNREIHAHESEEVSVHESQPYKVHVVKRYLRMMRVYSRDDDVIENRVPSGFYSLVGCGIVENTIRRISQSCKEEKLQSKAVADEILKL